MPKTVSIVMPFGRLRCAFHANFTCIGNSVPSSTSTAMANPPCNFIIQDWPGLEIGSSLRAVM